jgi:Na+/melibiose symporter-like transporter
MNAGTKIPTLTKILYGSGDFGYSMNNSIIAALFPIFMMDVVGVTPALAAAALFIGRSCEEDQQTDIRGDERWLDP